MTRTDWDDHAGAAVIDVAPDPLGSPVAGAVRVAPAPQRLGIGWAHGHPVHLLANGLALVPSRTQEGREYAVTCLSGVDPRLQAPVALELACECAAYVYRGQCAHQRMVATAWAAYHRWLTREREAERAAAYAAYWREMDLDPTPADLRRWDDLGYC